jgi:hypothetical protein
MLFRKIVTLVITCAIISGCNSPISETREKEKTVIDKFPKVRNLSDFKKTVFLPTLEHPLSKEVNSVYCVTLLYAWDEIRNKIKTPLEIDDSLSDLNLLHNSTSFNNVLEQDEYTVTGSVEGAQIKARAEFRKSLPFETNLQI